ncbi:MAG: uroporphyrinogen decarboxylase family protein [Candidatus Limivicinus sp.]|jgi:uroporphyrinogen decarboxylase
MTRKEAIRRLIERKPVGYTPHQFGFTLKIADDLARYYGISSDEVEEFIGNHMLYLVYDAPDGRQSGYRVQDNDGIYVDEFGVAWDNSRLYNIGDWGIVDHPIKNLDADGYKFPDGRGDGRFIKAEKDMERFPDRFNVLRMTGLFDNGWHLTGLEDFMVAMLTEEELTNNILDHCTEYMINIIRSAPEGIDAVRFIEDWGMQKGLLFSRELWLRYLQPRLKLIHAACRERGFYVMHHTCGDVTDLFDDIIDLGVDVLDSIQPESMDIAELKRKYGGRIIFFGGLGAQSTIPNGTPEDVVAEAERAIDILGKNGGYIIGPAGTFSNDTPIENVAALAEFCMQLRERGR